MAERQPGWFLRLLGPEGCAAAVAQSKAWRAVCPNCGYSRSVWEMGGVMYKAAGTTRRLITCPNCGQTSWHAYEKDADFPTLKAPLWPLLRLIFAMVVLLWLLIAGIILLVFKLTGLI